MLLMVAPSIQSPPVGSTCQVRSSSGACPYSMRWSDWSDWMVGLKLFSTSNWMFFDTVSGSVGAIRFWFGEVSLRA